MPHARPKETAVTVPKETGRGARSQEQGIAKQSRTMGSGSPGIIWLSSLNIDRLLTMFVTLLTPCPPILAHYPCAVAIVFCPKLAKKVE